MALTRAAQQGIKIEATEGTKESLSAADYVGRRKISNHKYTLGNYKRETTRNTLTEEANVKGGSRLLNSSWEEELVGGDASTSCGWHRTLMGMGFSLNPLKVASIGARSGGGDFNVGDLVGNNATKVSATKTAIVVMVITGSPDKVVFMPLTGTFINTDTMYNYATPQISGALSSTLSAAGFGFKPQTEVDGVVPPSATFTKWKAGRIHIGVGGRASGALTMEMDKPIILKADYQGAAAGDAGNSYAPALTASTTGIATLSVQPPLCKGNRIRIKTATGTVTPVLTMLDVSINNTLAPRGTISDTDSESSGYKSVKITGREIMVKMNPENVVAGNFDSYVQAMSGTTFSIEANAGSVSGPNGLQKFWIPNAQIHESFEEGDRDGIVTDDLDLKCTGDVDDELFVFHVFVP
jgi:hypothetical protein